MIEPISCNCGAGRKLNFTGAENNNFKGITSSLPDVSSTSMSARETYNQAVNDASEIQKEFMAPAGVAENLNLIG